jgi:hypothetical protein
MDIETEREGLLSNDWQERLWRLGEILCWIVGFVLLQPICKLYTPSIPSLHRLLKVLPGLLSRFRLERMIVCDRREDWHLIGG